MRLELWDGSASSSCEIECGSRWGARRVPSWFALAWERLVEAHGRPPILLAHTARGPRHRRIVRRGGKWYTREL